MAATLRSTLAAAACALVLAPAALALQAGGPTPFVDEIQDLRQRVAKRSNENTSAGQECAPSGSGVTCLVTLPGAYPRPVAIYSAAWPFQSGGELILYFHGQGGCDKWRSNSDFPQLLRDAGRPASIMVMPCGDDPWDAGDSAGYARFARAVLFKLGSLSGAGAQPYAPSAVTLAGHSHGGYAIGRVLRFASDALPQVRKVYLFDTSFSDSRVDRAYDSFAEFAVVPGNRLISVIVVAPDNAKIMTKLDLKGYAYGKLDAAAVLAGQQKLPATGTAFIDATKTKVTHEQVMNAFFAQMLR